MGKNPVTTKMQIEEIDKISGKFTNSTKEKNTKNDNYN